MEVPCYPPQGNDNTSQLAAFQQLQQHHSSHQIPEEPGEGISLF